MYQRLRSNLQYVLGLVLDIQAADLLTSVFRALAASSLLFYLELFSRG